MTPLVRSASLINYAGLARDAGLDPLAMLAEVGLPPDALDNLELMIPSARVRALIQRSAQRSGWQDFGLRLAETRHFWVLGPLAMAVREQPTLRGALTVLINHMRLHNEALHLWLEEENHTASLHLGASGSGGADTSQSMELSVATLHRFFSHALPAGWQPIAICFTHKAPTDLRTSSRVFGDTVQFGSDFNGIVFKTSALDLPMSTYARHDQLTREYLSRLTERPARSLSDQVRQLTLALLSTGQCSMNRIAEELGVDKRTMHRRLKQEDTAYSQLLNETRRELVQHYFVGPARKQTELAQMLGFSGKVVFSRWFRRQFGCAPREWKRSRSDDRGLPG